MIRKQFKFSPTAIAVAVLSALFAGPVGRSAQYGRVDVGDDESGIGRALTKAMDKLEDNLKTWSEKANGEFQTLGKQSKDTTTALETLGKQQLEFAERLIKIEQAGTAKKDDQDPDAAEKAATWGGQFVKAPNFKAWQEGQLQKIRLEVKDDGQSRLFNTVLTSGAAINPQRTAFVPGPFRTLRVEDALNSVDTTAGSIEFVRENVFTNAAAEVAEGAQKPESSLTFTLVQKPITTVAHWIKISRQLSKDETALVAYINQRMRYGVNLRVENQLISGNGVTPNLEGLLMTGNYTAHGYTAAVLGAVNTKLRLVRKVIADLGNTDYPADVVLMNPLDWADIELMVDTQGRYLIGDPQQVAQPRLWGLPVIMSAAVPLDSFVVMSRMAATVYNREGVVVEMSDSDADNFTKNLITIRAERRLQLAVEVPAAIRGGDITPA